MEGTATRRSPAEDNSSDEYVVKRVLAGETALYELLMRRNNQRIYRAALAILRDDTEAEDVMQEAYVRAYEHLSEFQGRAAFSTWLTRIAVHEAFRRLQTKRRFNPNGLAETTSFESLSSKDSNRKEPIVMTSQTPDPEQQAARRETSEILERAILSLPRDYRIVIMLRDVEEMSTSETADTLNITEESVKVRLHRARVRLRHELYKSAGTSKSAAFEFHAVRCDRVTKAVLARISAPRISPSGAA